MYVDIIYLCTMITVMSSLAFVCTRCLWTYLCTVMSSLVFVRARYVCGHNLSLYYDYCNVQSGVWLAEMCVDIFL